jgi:hypothetical protein
LTKHFATGSSIRNAALHKLIGASWQAKGEAIMATILERSGNGADKSNTEGT